MAKMAGNVAQRRAPDSPSIPSRAGFLWPHKTGSVEEAGYEFANAATEAYRKSWWKILNGRIRRNSPNDKAQTPPPKDQKS
jgi:hypothetical protein